MSGQEVPDSEEEDVRPNGHVPKKSRPSEVPISPKDEESSDIPLVGKMTTSLQRDVDGYVPGAIVKVYCRNFLTYDEVSFYPGPYLNFVVGANGTGKSTLACAMAIGLGFPPTVLNRATQARSFIKLGTKEAIVEITLKAKQGQKRNPVIRRTITVQSDEINARSDGTSTRYHINGVSATHQEIKYLAAEYNVQIGNLCAFLPQDRVASFASLSPRELLVESQKAAGHPKLYEWHQQLISLNNSSNEITTELNKLKTQRTHLEERNAGQQREIDRFNERLDLEHKVAVIKCLVPYVEYSEAKNIFTQCQDDLKKAKAALARMNREVEPLRQIQKLLVDRRDQVQGVKRGIEDNYAKNEMSMKRKEKEFSDAERKIEDLRDNLKSLRRSETRRRETIKRLKEEVSNLEEGIKNKPTRPDDTQEKAEIIQLQSQMRAIKRDVDEILKSQTECKEESDRLEKEIKEIEREMQSLDNVSRQRDDALRNSDKATYEAVLWIRENHHRFKDTVYEPIRMEVKPKERAYAKPIEACITFSNSRSILCRTRTDYELLATELNDKRKLRVNIVEVPKTPEYEPSSYHRPWSTEQLHKNGFDNWLVDMFDAPDPIKAYLCAVQYVHSVPVQLKERPINMQAFGGHDNRVQRYVTPTALSSVKVARYGARNEQTITRQIQEPTIYALGVDQSAYQNLTNRIAEIEREKNVQLDLIQKLQEKEGGLRSEHGEIKRRHDILQAEREKYITAEKEHQKKILKLEHSKKQLNSLLSTPSEASKRIELTNSLETIAKKRMDIALEYKESAMKSYKLMQEQSNQTLLTLQAESDLEVYNKNEFIPREQKLTEYQNQVVACQSAVTEAKFKAQKVRDKAQSTLETVPASVAEIVENSVRSGDVLSKTIPEYETELEGLQARLELVGNPNDHAVRQYEDRVNQINKLRTKIEEREVELDNVSENLAITRSEWLPKLEELVDEVSRTFSQALERMGCTGDVRIGQKGSYSEWEMEILVSFRDNEEMQLLTGQRQSGGERSLATVVYLMSLLRLARAPFSLVDEINQGMDQRAERAVHTEFVEVTCSDDAAGQSFLITPKLLPGLRYHPRMRCLCVNNGEWLPEALDLKQTVLRKMGKA